MNVIYAEKTVSVSEARKNLSKYFTDEPVAVLSNNKPAGYMISATAFEQMVEMLAALSPAAKSCFRPASGRLEAIAHLHAELLLSATDSELGDFQE